MKRNKMFQFDLQLFGSGGGGGTSTTIQKTEIAPQTEEERRLQAALAEYQNRGLEGAKDLQKRALDYMNSGGLVNPDWNRLLEQWNYENDNMTDVYRGEQASINRDLKTALQNAQDYYRQTAERAVRDQNESNDTALQKYQYELNKAQNLSDYDTGRAVDAYNAANSSNTSAFNSEIASAAKAYQDVLSDNSEVSQRHNSNLQNALDQYRADSMADTNSYSAAMQQYLNDYNARIKAAEDKYNATNNQVSEKYRSGMDELDAGFKDLSNGILAGDWAKNRQQALMDDLNATTGSLISNMAKRGIINSTITSSGLDSINQSASDSLAKSFANDMGLQANILSQRGGFLKDYYDTTIDRSLKEFNGAAGVYGDILSKNTGVAGDIYKSKQNVSNNLYEAATKTENQRFNDDLARHKGIYDSRNAAAKGIYDANDSAAKTRYATNMDAINKAYDHAATNLGNIYNATYANNNNAAKSILDVAGNIYNGSQADAQNIYNASNATSTNIFNAGQQHLQNKLTGALQTQIGSYYAPKTMMDMAQQLYLPSQNQFNTLYQGRHGAATTTTTTNTSGGGDDSALFGAIGSVGSAFIACFTAGTQITTPDGYKNIEDIKPGDEVMSVNKDGDLVIAKVKTVNEPHKAATITVQWDNSTRWRTTINQRYYNGRHFSNFIKYGKGAKVFNGYPTYIFDIEEGPEALVYDFTVDNDINVFFANDVAAEGYGD